MNRRDFVKTLTLFGSTAAALGTPLYRAFAGPDVASEEFFLFIHAQGAWDVTVGLDPRNERIGLVEPASTNTIDPAPIRRWTSRTTPLDGTSALVRLFVRAGSSSVGTARVRSGDWRAFAPCRAAYGDKRNRDEYGQSPGWDCVFSDGTTPGGSKRWRRASTR